jgi:hypothetical protein
MSAEIIVALINLVAILANAVLGQRRGAAAAQRSDVIVSKVDDVHKEVQAVNGTSVPQIIEANEGRRIAADIPRGERTTAEQGYVDRLKDS